MTIREQNRSNRNAGILIAVLAFIMILLIQNTAEAQKFNYKRVEKEQYERSYEKWRKDQPKKKLEAIKYAVWASNENYKEYKSNEKLNKKINRIRQRIK